MPPEEETNPQYLQIVLCFFPSTGVACCQASSSGLPFLAVFEAGAAYLKKEEEDVQRKRSSLHRFGEEDI